MAAALIDRARAKHDQTSPADAAREIEIFPQAWAVPAKHLVKPLRNQQALLGAGTADEHRSQRKRLFAPARSGFEIIERKAEYRRARTLRFSAPDEASGLNHPARFERRARLEKEKPLATRGRSAGGHPFAPVHACRYEARSCPVGDRQGFVARAAIGDDNLAHESVHGRRNQALETARQQGCGIECWDNDADHGAGNMVGQSLSVKTSKNQHLNCNFQKMYLFCSHSCRKLRIMSTARDQTFDPRLGKGRGALSNATGRYEPHQRVLTDDGWDDGWRDTDLPPPPLRTEVLLDASRTIIARNKSPDISFDQSINPYRGCEHGCIYCFARPTHAYLGLSPGADFESRIFAKPNAADLLAKELSAPGYVPKVIAIGTNTDPYQPLEKKMRVTRSILEVLKAFHHPVGIVTKSPLILRDLDILAPMASEGLAKVALSVTTLDRKLARMMEPRAGTPTRRLQAIKALADAKVPAGVMFAPAIPALNDSEMEAVLGAAAEMGATTAGYVLLRLPLEIKDLFREWLETHAPDRARHVMSLIRQMRGGKDYDSQSHTRMKGTGAYAEMIARRFHMAVKRYGLNRDSRPLTLAKFKRPERAGDQLRLL